MKKKKKSNDLYIKNALIGIITILLYIILHNIEGLPFEILNIDITSLPQYIKIIYLTVYDILMMAIFAIIFNKELVANFKDMKKNHKEYYSKYFKYYLIGFAIMIISNAIIIFLMNKGIANNEEAIREAFKISPLYIYFSGIIFAPFVEELIFRGAIRKIIPFKYLFVLISGFVFAYVHVSTYINNPSDLLYLIPYGALGTAFAYVYAKTDNIFTNMGLHFMHNGILLSFQFLILLLG